MAESKTAQSNVPEFSVSDLAFSLKKTLEETFGHVRIRGELGRVTIPRSGHLYTNLKDEDASIDAVCWKGVLSKLSIKPEEGLEVIVTGRVSSYPASSKYQIIIESMELAGEGALLKMLEERRKKLAAEGLFAPERKQKLPFLPRTIGVVTSPTGAVIRDILHRLADRFPRDVLLWPVMVQGDGAAEQIAAAINGFQTLGDHGLPRPDVLIVGRGGGSLEDLMPFNEEIVVRAVADSTIPVISAVGHETDTTLIDYVADLRAPTPTGAAEMAVPRRGDLIAQIAESEGRMVGAVNRMLSDGHNKLEARSGRLGDPAKLLEVHTQKLDHIGDKIGRIFDSYLGLKKHKLIEFSAKLRDPSNLLREAAQRLERWDDQLKALTPRIVGNFEKRLEHAEKMLEAYSFENVLQRGFAVVQKADGTLITGAEQTTLGQQVQLRFKENKSVDATIGAGANVEKPPSKPKKSKEKKTDQHSLF
ncbi:MAG: exodeoxyribonuclease VII large subunit [Alphaproteobacteria bacterium]|nr:exodeoxyribonuclease VII large subunit [Alphaproteobacteria bacterium]